MHSLYTLMYISGCILFEISQLFVCGKPSAILSRGTVGFFRGLRGEQLAKVSIN